MATMRSAAVWALLAVAPWTVQGGCSGDGTTWENGLCTRLSDMRTCILTPGCNWYGQSTYGGWCTGGPLCPAVAIREACAAVSGCSWVPATATASSAQDEASETAPASAQYACAGTHDWCRWLVERTGCMWTPGCNWGGQSYFGGRCQGGPICWYQPTVDACYTYSSCSWLPSAWAASELPEAGQLQSAGGKDNLQVNATAYGCQGVHSWCYDTPDPTGCMWTPGCNWNGANYFGGHCQGGEGCVHEPTVEDCTAWRTCVWVPSPRPLASGLAEANSTDSAQLNEGGGRRLRGSGSEQLI